MGSASLLIACKLEEIYPPKLKHFVKISDSAFDKGELEQAEFLIL